MTNTRELVTRLNQCHTLFTIASSAIDNPSYEIAKAACEVRNDMLEKMDELKKLIKKGEIPS